MSVFDEFDEYSCNVNLGEIIRLRDFSILMFNFLKSKDLLSEFEKYRDNNSFDIPLDD